MKWALVLTGWLLLSSNAVAQVGDAATTQELIQKLLTRIDTLEQRITELERQVRELRRANEILKAAAGFFARELDPRLPG